MILRSFVKFYLFILFLSLSFNNQLRYVKSYTSLINSTDLIKYNDDILVTTEGGLYTYNSSGFDFYIDELRFKDINCISQDTINDYFWLGINYPNGIVQIIDRDLNLISSIDYVIFDSIEKIEVGEEFSFAIIVENGEYGIAQYSNNHNLSSYINVYYDFIDNLNIINDIIVLDDIIYVATDAGLYWINYENSFLNDPSGWNSIYVNSNTSHLINYLDMLLVCIEDSIYDTVYDLTHPPIFSFEEFENILSIKIYDGLFYILTEDSLYKIDYDNSEEIDTIFLLPDEIDTYLVDFEIINDQIYFALFNQGIIIANSNGDYNHSIPNSIFTNVFNSIVIQDNKNLVGISKNGGFIIEDIFSINEFSNIKNFYAVNKYQDSNYPNYASNDYFGQIMPYISGSKDPLSILPLNDAYYFINSGIFPDPNEYPGYENNLLASLLKIDMDNLEILDSWGDDIFEGMNGIYNPQWTSGYMVVNQIKSLNGNLYVLNPYSEGDINRPIKIFLNEEDWLSVEDDENFNTYLPTEFSFDDFNNIWVSYQSENELYADSDISYSPGGLRVVDVNDINNPNDDIWYNNIYSDLNGINIWSIDIGKDIYGNEILWAITDLGVMGYIIDITFSITDLMQIELSPINPYYYFSEIPFEEGCRIRVDKQNNAWITTKNDGLKVVRSNGQIWPDNYGINSENTDLLSNTIYDVSFDDFGYVYISTNKGISIFETVFSNENIISNISLSPNPFIIDGENSLTIGNIPSGSILQIMNLSGKVVKSFQLENENTIFNWNGKDDLGNYLLTGVYLVTSYHHKKESFITKLAVIRK